MRLGLIARADNSGLGVQCLEFYRHMQPDRVLVIDVGHLHNDSTHTNKRTFLDRYPGAMVFKGWVPDRSTLSAFLSGLDVVFTAETTYSAELVPLAHSMGVKVVVQPNPEFLELRWPHPDLWAPPTRWLWDSIPEPKVLLPVPIATDRFVRAAETKRSVHGATHFLHVVGRPAVHDRNGTADLLHALQHVTSRITVRITCQQPGHVDDLIRTHNVRTPSNVTLVVDSGDVENYWDNYTDGDVLVMPRRFGGLCLPVNEALGAGMPVIMPDISPNSDWLPGEWLVPATHAGTFMVKQPVDYYSAAPHVLAAKIDQFADPEFHAQAKSNAGDLRERYSWATLAPHYAKVLGDESVAECASIR